MIRLLKLLKPFSGLIILALALVFCQSLADLKLPSLMARIVDDGIAKSNVPFIWQTGKIMLVVALGGALAAIFVGYLSARISSGFGRDLRSKVFSHIESFSLHEFDKFGTASLITRTTNDIMQIQMVVLMSLRMVVSAPMMCIGGIVMALSEDRSLTWILVYVMPVIAFVIGFLAIKGLPLFKVIQKKIDRLNLLLRENLVGVRVIRAFNRGEFEADRFNQANRDLTQTSMRVQRLMAFAMPAMMLILNVTAVTIVWIGGHRIDAGTLEVGSMMAFIQYSMQILMSLLMVSMIFVMLPRASASAERVFQVLNERTEIVDPDRELPSLGPIKGQVEFRDVTFSYPGAEAPAISHVSFKTMPGEVTAILGGTGSGKSTLVNLIPRFYDVGYGQVLIDGRDVRDITQEELRQKIGLVPQKAVLFSGTVAENIRYGNLEATDAEVQHAAEVAQALEFITKMDGMFEAEISQGGTNLSGGQKQRLSIARAIARKPEIYIFDDCFGALDFKTEAKVRMALKGEIGEATVIIVAQRVSSVMDADRIIVLDEGKVAGIGTHRDLMKTCPVYREIVSSQLSEEEIA